MPDWLRSFARRYGFWSSLLVAAASFVLAAVQGNALWLVPAVLILPALIVVIAAAVRRIREWAAMIRQFPVVLDERDSWRASAEEYRAQLERLEAQTGGVIAAAMVEGAKRVSGARRGAELTAMPRITHTVVGYDGSVTITAVPGDAQLVSVGARIILRSDATRAQLGVMEVTDVAPDGGLTVVCIEETDAHYWSGVHERRGDNQGPLLDVSFDHYDPDRAHARPGASVDPFLDLQEGINQ